MTVAQAQSNLDDFNLADIAEFNLLGSGVDRFTFFNSVLGLGVGSAVVIQTHTALKNFNNADYETILTNNNAASRSMGGNRPPCK